MLNIVSLLIGGIALMMTLVALLPFLGWANWFILPFAFLGLCVGLFSRFSSGRTLNLIVIATGLLRLVLGHGIF